MKRSAQRIAIAEIVGPWKFERQGDYTVIKEGPRTKMRFYPTDSEEEIRDRLYLAGVPDYLSDLNAMHEAEGILLRDMNRFWFPYAKRLQIKTNGIGEGATAAQRAEAFLRSLSLWK